MFCTHNECMGDLDILKSECFEGLSIVLDKVKNLCLPRVRCLLAEVIVIFADNSLQGSVLISEHNCTSEETTYDTVN